MTGQSLLDRMEIVNQELQLQSGETDVTRGLIALNMAQDYFESVAAQRAGLFSSGIGTVTTTASTESTAFPSNLLRLDRLQRINGSTSRSEAELFRIHRTGGHASSSQWPYSLTVASGTGKPSGYWTNGTNIYWQPLPDATYTVRWYGFQAATDITASGTFLYPDIVSLPLATFAVKLLLAGVGDTLNDMSGLATEFFRQVLDTLSSVNRDGASPLEYTQIHSA